MILSQEFPFLDRTYEIERVVSTPSEILVQAQSRRGSATCPSCGELSHRMHSFYERRVCHQPCAGRPVVLQLRVQRFRCQNPSCRGCTFVEPVEGLAVRHAQPTIAQGQAVQALAVALGGQGAARLARRVGLGQASACTMLRWVRAVELPEQPVAQVVGIDDWAWRRAERYGTILVDLQRGQPIDLLADSSVQAIADWLRQQGQVRVLVRHRSKIGGSFADLGAPQAVQVADRFHLAQNLSDQLAAGFEQHPVRPDRPPPKAEGSEPATQEVLLPQSSKEQCYAQMQTLHAAGWSVRAIAREVGSPRSTVHTWLTHGCPPASWVRRRASRESGGKASHDLSWALGKRPCCWCAPLRACSSPNASHWSTCWARVANWRRSTSWPKASCACCANATSRPWLEQAKGCAWSQLRQLARGLQQDLAAVQAALTWPSSNGAVEGLITRLKLLKRSMYGRACLDWLRQRFLACP